MIQYRAKIKTKRDGSFTTDWQEGPSGMSQQEVKKLVERDSRSARGNQAFMVRGRPVTADVTGAKITVEVRG